MWFENEIKINRDAFTAKVKQVGNALGINPNYLMAVMSLESGLRSDAVNPVTGASGLIQFMPATARNLGTTLKEIREMSNVEQLDYVYSYLSTYSGKMNSLADVYFAVFFPAAIGKPDSFVLQTSSLSASKIASQNPIFDLNKDSVITVGEVKEYWNKFLKKKGLL